MKPQPKILLADLETSPNKVYCWGVYDQNIAHDQVIESGSILCWSAKWLGERSIQYCSSQHRPVKEMLKKLHTLFDEADVVITYNGNSFDIPTANKEFIRYQFPPPSPYKQLDMLLVVRRAFRFNSNKLTNVTDTLGIGVKVKHEGFKLWVKCMDGDPEAWERMKRYNKHDVRLLERLYKRLLPWIDKHPNLAVYHERPACVNCGSTHITKQGKQVKQTLWYQQYQCQACSRWFMGERIK